MSNSVLKICCGTWQNASHDKRELSIYRELGEEVAVLAKGDDNDYGRIEEVDSFKVFRYTTRPVKKFPISINRIISLFQWAHFAKRLEPDVITGHDIDGLTIGWMSTWFQKKKAKLIYDSHEFELERNVERSKIQLKLIKILEGHLIKKSIFMTVVNEEIGCEIKRIYALNEMPVITRNMPYYWNIDAEVQEKTRQSIIPENLRNKFILMYHGVLMKGRGLETLLEVIKCNKGVGAVILGNGRQEYIDSLRASAKKAGFIDRIVFHPAVPIEELWKYVGAADAGMILAPATCKNHLYSLPNKFFENIHSGTPVICPNYPSMKGIVDKYKVGITCNPTSITEVSAAIKTLMDDKEKYKEFKENCIKAKKILCWENESKALKSAYQKKIMI